MAMLDGLNFIFNMAIIGFLLIIALIVFGCTSVYHYYYGTDIIVSKCKIEPIMHIKCVDGDCDTTYVYKHER